MDLKEAIALSVQRALTEFDQFDDLRESYLEDEKALKLSIAITIPNGRGCGGVQDYGGYQVPV